MNTFGRLFKIGIFGESHGSVIGVTVDGCPAGIPLTEKDFYPDLERRKSGAKGTTPRIETDQPTLVSGIFNGYTTGAPLTIQFENNNIRTKDYVNLVEQPRPGHADFTAQKKFDNFADYRGGGHFSGRMTLALVAAGVVAKKMIHPIKLEAHLVEAGGQRNVERAVMEAIDQKNSIGGVVECKAYQMPVGIGEPFFDSVESVISHLCFAIPAVKGIEFGAGFEATKMTGADHNDLIIDKKGTTSSNHAGGINGGISNGNELVFRLAIKPPSSISSAQQSVNLKSGVVEELVIQGRHDTCIALRVPPVAEAAAAIALADLFLVNNKVFKQAQRESKVYR